MDETEYREIMQRLVAIDASNRRLLAEMETLLLRQQASTERVLHHEDILRRLAGMLDAQHTMNEQQRTINARMAMYVEQQTAINQGVQTTLARVETLLARMLRQEDNGQDV